MKTKLLKTYFNPEINVRYLVEQCREMIRSGYFIKHCRKSNSNFGNFVTFEKQYQTAFYLISLKKGVICKMNICTEQRNEAYIHIS